jgi:hypothetical protein
MSCMSCTEDANTECHVCDGSLCWDHVFACSNRLCGTRLCCECNDNGAAASLPCGQHLQPFAKALLGRDETNKNAAIQTLMTDPMTAVHNDTVTLHNLRAKWARCNAAWKPSAAPTIVRSRRDPKITERISLLSVEDFCATTTPTQMLVWETVKDTCLLDGCDGDVSD